MRTKLIKMRILLLFISIFQASCFYLSAARFDEVVRKSPEKWSSRDCLTVIVSSMVNNLSDKESNVQIIGTPYYPSVVAAINQLQRKQHHWDDNEAAEHLDALLKQGVGLYVDRFNGKLVSSKGNYFKDHTDIDSLLIAVTLKNKTWPCAVPLIDLQVGFDQNGNPLYKTLPLSQISDWPCLSPSITDIESRIFLITDRGDTLRPKFIWGRKNDQLTMEETVFVMFTLRNGMFHFFEKSEAVSLCITGFEKDMKFALDMSKMR